MATSTVLNNVLKDYDQIIKDINANFDIKITRRDKGIAMVDHYHPISITQSEFSYIYHTIKQQNLKNGYEVATAFGISGLAASLAFKETNGRMVTMDAYIEEKYNNAGKYHGIVDKFTDCHGYKLANFIYKFYNTENHIKTTVGWSPNDTRKCLSSVFDLSKDKLDYVFIDAGHWDEYLIHDIASIVRFFKRSLLYLYT
jgi:hypothetical protein